MSHFLKISIFLLSFSAPCFSNSLNNYLDFYMGTDAQIRSMKLKKGFGDNLLHKTHPQGNIYVGFSLSDNINIEIGRESTMTRTCTSALTTGECSAGIPVVEPLSPVIFKTKLKIKGPYASLVFSYPFENYPIKFLGSIGVSAIKGTSERKTISFSKYSVQSGTVRTMSKHKEALRLMCGIQYLTTSGLGFRSTISFVKTRKIVIKKDDMHPSIYIPIIKLKDSIVYGLGAFWVF